MNVLKRRQSLDRRRIRVRTAFRGMLVATVLILTLLSEATDTDEPVGVIPRDAHSDEAVAAVGREACHIRF